MTIFRLLTDGQSELLEGSLVFLGLIWLVALAGYVSLYARKNIPFALPLLEILCLASCFYLLPPLWGFAVYFCLVHSPRHFRRLFADYGNSRNTFADILQIITLSALTITAMLVTAQMLPDLDYTNNLVRTVFIGLAALTVPHMVLVDALPAWYRKEG